MQLEYTSKHELSFKQFCTTAIVTTNISDIDTPTPVTEKN